MYFLAGGKIDDEGSICSCLEVEIKEETGINIDLSNGQPFLLVQQYVSDYPKRDNQGFSNRLSETFYFIIHNNDEIKVEEMSLTEKEKKVTFQFSEFIQVILKDYCQVTLLIIQEMNFLLENY